MTCSFRADLRSLSAVSLGPPYLPIEIARSPPLIDLLLCRPPRAHRAFSSCSLCAFSPSLRGFFQCIIVRCSVPLFPHRFGVFSARAFVCPTRSLVCHLTFSRVVLIHSTLCDRAVTHSTCACRAASSERCERTQSGGSGASRCVAALAERQLQAPQLDVFAEQILLLASERSAHEWRRLLFPVSLSNPTALISSARPVSCPTRSTNRALPRCTAMATTSAMRSRTAVNAQRSSMVPHDII